MQPEEKLASRLLERHDLVPPYDLEELVLLYADIDYLGFPYDADGISLGLKQINRPKIYINSTRHPVRQRFTLAHELGHVIIPWHTGNIISHTNLSIYEENASVIADSSFSEEEDYRWLEREANRFAAELLLPTIWLLKVCQNVEISNFKEIIENVMQESQSSRDTTLIKIFTVLPPGYICAEINHEDTVINSFTSPGTQVYKPHRGTNCSSDHYPICKDKMRFNLSDRNYILWSFENAIELPEKSTDMEWREVLKIILNDTNLHSRRQSICTVLPSLFQSVKQSPDSEVFARIVHRYSEKDDLKDFVQHPLFEQYVVKRLKELRKKYP